MSYFLALFFLGLIQGLTEFLPVSSSGHLVLFSKIFGVEESLFISILLHVATLLSILVVFRKDIWQMIRHPFSQQTMMLVVATIPTCLIVLVLMPLVKQSFAGGFLPISFLVSSILLFVSEIVSKKKNSKPIDFKSAFIMGVAKFSFLMSVPIVILSLLMEIYEIATGAEKVNIQALPTIVSFVVAFVVGIFAIKVMIKLTEKSNLKWFALYLLVMSVVSIFVI